MLTLPSGWCRHRRRIPPATEQGKCSSRECSNLCLIAGVSIDRATVVHPATVLVMHPVATIHGRPRTVIIRRHLFAELSGEDTFPTSARERMLPWRPDVFWEEMSTSIRERRLPWKQKRSWHGRHSPLNSSMDFTKVGNT